MKSIAKMFFLILCLLIFALAGCTEYRIHTPVVDENNGSVAEQLPGFYQSRFLSTESSDKDEIAKAEINFEIRKYREGMYQVIVNNEHRRELLFRFFALHGHNNIILAAVDPIDWDMFGDVDFLRLATLSTEQGRLVKEHDPLTMTLSDKYQKNLGKGIGSRDYYLAGFLKLNGQGFTLVVPKEGSLPNILRKKSGDFEFFGSVEEIRKGFLEATKDSAIWVPDQRFKSWYTKRVVPGK